MCQSLWSVAMSFDCTSQSGRTSPFGGIDLHIQGIDGFGKTSHDPYGTLRAVVNSRKCTEGAATKAQAVDSRSCPINASLVLPAATMPSL